MHNGRIMAVPPAGFGSSLSRILYVDADVDGAVRPVRPEALLVERVCHFVRTAQESHLHAACHYIETEIMPRLCGQSVLALGEAVEAAAPWMFENLPSLAAHRDRLRRASEFAEVFGRDRLGRLARAIQDEAAR